MNKPNHTGFPTFGNFLSGKRKQHGFTQYRLGYLLGVSAKTVSKWEKGQTMPSNDHLMRLCKILDLTSDELLSGKDHSEHLAERISLADSERNLLWKKAHDILSELYPTLPLEVLDRFHSEKLKLQNTDMIRFFDLIARLAKQAEVRHCPILTGGGIGGSFVAYLLGASDINPLPPHYYCPVCKTIEFVPNASDGWDLPPKICNTCQNSLIRDGHGLPFEIYQYLSEKNPGISCLISRKFYLEAKDILTGYFRDRSVVIVDSPPDMPVTMQTFIFQSAHTPKDPKENGAASSCEEYGELLSNHPYIDLMFDDDYENCIALEQILKVPRKTIPFLEEAVLQELYEGKIEGLPGFEVPNLLPLYKHFPPRTLSEAIHLYGVAFCTEVTKGEGESFDIRNQTRTSIENMLVYRDDVYHYIMHHMKSCGKSSVGFAYQIMDDARKGIYYRQGMNPNTKHILLNSGISKQYIERLEQTTYMIGKSHGIVHVKYLLILLWYKKYHSKLFRTYLNPQNTEIPPEESPQKINN